MDQWDNVVNVGLSHAMWDSGTVDILMAIFVARELHMQGVMCFTPPLQFSQVYIIMASSNFAVLSPEMSAAPTTLVLTPRGFGILRSSYEFGKGI